jgi:transcriptional regulator with XRE-family HTH domain
MTPEKWSRVIMALGKSVRELRRLTGWSQQQLADRAVVSQGLISRMENARCDDLPFHSVVVVLRTLGAAAVQLDLPVSPRTEQLLAFIESLLGPFLVDADPDLVAIVQHCTHLSPTQRRLFRRFVRSAAEVLIGQERGNDSVYADEPMTTVSDLSDLSRPAGRGCSRLGQSETPK